MTRVLFKNFDRSEALEDLAFDLLDRVDYHGEPEPEVTVIFEMRNGPFKRGKDEFLVKLVGHWPWGTYQPIEKRDPSPYKAMRFAVNALRTHLNRMLQRKHTSRSLRLRDLEYVDQSAEAEILEVDSSIGSSMGSHGNNFDRVS